MLQTQHIVGLFSYEVVLCDGRGKVFKTSAKWKTHEQNSMMTFRKNKTSQNKIGIEKALMDIHQTESSDLLGQKWDWMGRRGNDKDLNCFLEVVLCYFYD